jgi:hypothetical protein
MLHAWVVGQTRVVRLLGGALLLAVLVVPAGAGVGNVMEDLIRGTARVADDLPLRRTDELLEQLSKAKATRELIEQELKTAGKLPASVGDAALLTTHSRDVLRLLRQSTAHLDPSIMRRLEQLDEASRDAALVFAKGGEHLSKTLPDIASRGRFLKEAGPETVAAIGQYGPDSAREALRLGEAIWGGTLKVPPGRRAVTVADFGTVMTKFGKASWQFWQAYVQPRWMLWLGSGALAVYLANPEYFQDAAGQLTEAGVKHLIELAGTEAAAIIRGLGQGAGSAAEQVRQSFIETFFRGWHGLSAGIGTLLVLCVVACLFRRIRLYALWPFRWI